jgi:multimeric flavodoxin WrbA
MKRLHIIWHSRTGASAQIVQAILQLLTSDSLIEVRAFEAKFATAHTMLAADGLLFLAPENLGSLSGAMKEFFDQNYYACLDGCNGKAYASVIVAGSDGQGAERQLDRICVGLRLRRVVESLIVITHAQSAAQIAAPKKLSHEQIAPALTLAQTLAEGLKLGIF